MTQRKSNIYFNLFTFLVQFKLFVCIIYIVWTVVYVCVCVCVLMYIRHLEASQ